MCSVCSLPQCLPGCLNVPISCLTPGGICIHSLWGKKRGGQGENLVECYQGLAHNRTLHWQVSFCLSSPPQGSWLSREPTPTPSHLFPTFLGTPLRDACFFSRDEDSKCSCAPATAYFQFLIVKNTLLYSIHFTSPCIAFFCLPLFCRAE